MKGLKDQNNIIVFEAYNVRFGKVDENEPDIDKWGLYDEEGNVLMFAIDFNFTAVEFDPADKPDDYVAGKYLFINGEFVPNPDWVEPPLPIEQQVAQLQDDVAIVAQSAEDSEEALCDLDENMSQRLADIEEALCELAELLS